MIFSKANLFKLKKALLNLGEVSTEEGLLIYDGENLEVGIEVFVDGEDGLTPAKDGIYTYNNEIIEVEGGIVKTISEKEVEQPTEEEQVETTEETVETVESTEPIEETVEPVEEPVEETVEGTTVDELNSIIEEQKATIETLKAEIEELKKKLEEPAAKPAEEEFKTQKPIEKGKVDFSKYIKKNKNN